MHHLRNSIRNRLLNGVSYNHFHSGLRDTIGSRARTLAVFAYGKREHRSRTAKLRRLKQARGTASGPLLILGAGGSVSTIDHQWISYFRANGGRLMFSNGAAALPSEWVSCDDYLVLADPAYLADAGEDLSLSDDVKIDRQFLSRFAGTVFFPAAKEQPVSLSSNDVMFFNFDGLEGLGSGVDPTRPRRYSGVTILSAIAIGLYLGHEPILVCGVDQDYVRFLQLDGLNQVHVSGAHFYDEPPKPWNAPGKDMADILYDTARILRDMRLFLGQPVVNLGGEISFVDVFPRACPWYPPTCASEG